MEHQRSCIYRTLDNSIPYRSRRTGDTKSSGPGKFGTVLANHPGFDVPNSVIGPQFPQSYLAAVMKNLD